MFAEPLRLLFVRDCDYTAQSASFSIPDTPGPRSAGPHASRTASRGRSIDIGRWLWSCPPLGVFVCLSFNSLCACVHARACEFVCMSLGSMCVGVPACGCACVCVTAAVDTNEPHSAAVNTMNPTATVKTNKIMKNEPPPQPRQMNPAVALVTNEPRSRIGDK